MQRLAGKYGHSLFVGVDEYDAPANNIVFTGNTSTIRDTIAKVTEIEQFFKLNFFAPLKEACGNLSTGGQNAIISKYFLTGVTPAFRSGISPLTAVSIVSHYRKLHGMCGFTDKEVKAIVQYYLHKSGE